MFRPIVPFVSYAINYDYISTELCENKEKPEMKCNGKCHLKKELAKEVQQNNPKSDSKKINFVETSILFCSELTPFNFESCFIEKENLKLMQYANLYQRNHDFTIFHPPILFS